MLHRIADYRRVHKARTAFGPAPAARARREEENDLQLAGWAHKLPPKCSANNVTRAHDERVYGRMVECQIPRIRVGVQIPPSSACSIYVAMQFPFTSEPWSDKKVVEDYLSDHRLDEMR